MKTKAALPHLIEVVRFRFGLDFGGARLPVLLEGLARLGPEAEVAAGQVLRADHAGLAEFVGTLTNSETYFFRHAEQLTALTALLRRQWSAQPPVVFRAWSAGCASGEEALSLSAVIEDVCAFLPVRPVASILATDLSPAALGLAKRARYSEWSFRGVLPEQRARFFTRDGAIWVPKPSLQERITFQRHNLLEPAPEPVPFDLVVCRNVLIYFDAQRTEQAINRLALAVAPGGLLVLGPVESAAAVLPDFDVLHTGSSILYRKRTAALGQALPGSASTWPVASWPPSAPRPSAPPFVAAPPVPAPAPRPSAPPPPARPPRSFAERLAEASALADGGRLDDAKASADALRREFGDLGELRILSALIALELGDELAAASELEVAIAKRADLAMAHYLLGSILDDQGAREQAEARFRHALGVLDGHAPQAPVVGGGGLTTADLVDTLTHALGLSAEVRR